MPSSRWPSLVAALLTAGCAARSTPAPAPAPATPPVAARTDTPRPPAAPTRDAVAVLRSTIDSLADAPEFRNAHWGILIVDPASRDTLYSRNADKLFMPASNMKLVTSSVAVAQLGMDYRWRTSLVARGPVRNGVLLGDLVVVGRGDPSVSDHALHDAMTVMNGFADSLAAKGIRTIRGRVVAGGDAFPGPTLGFGWAWDDLEDDYSAPIDELLFNEGIYEIHLTAAATGRHRRVSFVSSPTKTTPIVRVDSLVVGPAPEGAQGEAARHDVRVRKDTVRGGYVLSGYMTPGDTTTVTVTQRDPDAAYVAALVEALRARKIAIRGRKSDTTAAGDTLVRYQSPTLREVLPWLMKPSQNQIAEMIFRTTALEKAGVGLPDSARAIETRQLEEWGAAPDGFQIRDGSGLSRYDYVSPHTLMVVLDAMRRAPGFADYYAALPIAGVDGTIDYRMKGTPAQNNLHAKTGTISNARSLSGYVTTADGRMLQFVILCNNFTVPVREVTRVQDAVGVALASFRR